jgi:hypothetical protein
MESREAGMADVHYTEDARFRWSGSAAMSAAVVVIFVLIVVLDM